MSNLSQAWEWFIDLFFTNDTREPVWRGDTEPQKELATGPLAGIVTDWAFEQEPHILKKQFTGSTSELN